jgi:hypothetical protein
MKMKMYAIQCQLIYSDNWNDLKKMDMERYGRKEMSYQSIISDGS